jgi:hypothetical protein
MRYRSPAIDLWTEDGIVVQIRVHDGYRGKLLGVVGVGSSLADIEVQLGEWLEDIDSELLLIDGVSGIGFDVRDRATISWGQQDLDTSALIVDRFYVFPPDGQG